MGNFEVKFSKLEKLIVFLSIFFDHNQKTRKLRTSNAPSFREISGKKFSLIFSLSLRFTDEYQFQPSAVEPSLNMDEIHLRALLPRLTHE